MRISDWSSDVCSSDLMRPYTEAAPLAAFFLGISSGFPYAMIGATLTTRLACRLAPESATNALELGRLQAATGDFDGARRSFRSEARCVGKEWLRTCRSRRTTHPSTKKNKKSTP